MVEKLWGGRFNTTPSDAVLTYTASIGFDYILAEEDVLGSLAHIAMLSHCDIISSDEYQQLKQGLQQIAKQISAGDFSFNVEDEDIHMNIERLLTQSIGKVAEKLHTARSRNDQVALDLHLYLRKEIINIVELIANLQKTLLILAERHKDVILPGYTHLQRAQPIILAQHWLAYFAMLQRDSERLQEIWVRVNQSPLGACALNGTTLPTDKNFVADLLAFDDIYFNTVDAVSDRDFEIEFISAASIMMMHLSRLSEELVLWSSLEFNFISFDENYCTGSSIMPQKKNPDVVELSRGKTGRVYGALFTLLTVLKGLPLAYNKDLQEDKEPLFDVIKTVKQTLAIYSPLLVNLNVHADVMQKAAEEGYLNATLLAEYLVKKGLPFRKAHQVSGKMVLACINKSCQLEDLTLKEMQAFSTLIENDIYAALNIQNCMASKQLHWQKEASKIKLTEAWVKSKTERLIYVRQRLLE